ncbi:MAG: CDP-2,3-bis-(O-geranylgeranyl)-sn-glycerol synthase [Thermoplasmatota archaeon]
MPETLYATVFQALWLFLPAYLANMAPVFVGGGKPVDGGRVWKDGRRMLGDGKTWRGLLLGPLAAALVMLLFVAGRPLLVAIFRIEFEDLGPLLVAIPVFYVLGFGALAGDATESFFKRRIGKERGARWLGFDQLDFVVGAFVLGFALAYPWMIARWTLARVLAIVILTPALHLIVNYIGWKIGKKDVPW